MKLSSLKEIKKELELRSDADLLSFCLRLIKFKKENKELITFLLFHANDITSYIKEVKEQTTKMFEEINRQHLFYEKKSTRKILRYVNKQVRFAADKAAEAELRIHFCNCMITFALLSKKSRQLLHLYQQQLKKIEEILSSVHPDLQFDLKKQMIQ